MVVMMRARRLGGALDLRKRNRASWTADDQYRWKGLLSVVIGLCLSAFQCSATESISDVGQESKTFWRILQTLSLVALSEDALAGNDTFIAEEIPRLPFATGSVDSYHPVSQIADR